LRRLEAEVPLDTLANALGVSFRQVQKYERGTNRMSAATLYRLAMTLEVPVQYFFEGPNARRKKRREWDRLVGFNFDGPRRPAHTR
jgi:transcriptional regulator with XRE-family HTH domain